VPAAEVEAVLGRILSIGRKEFLHIQVLVKDVAALALLSGVVLMLATARFRKRLE
jgi:hypothetical protein